MGFTVVDVNMRGTGCSGGAFDFFEPLQSLDGYDVIETIARQPWVLHHKVGMMGISYGGISQLFTAQTNPPSLAAISPLSVIDATQTTLYPGGILNTGFAVAWAKERVHDAKPASPTGGQPWAYKRIQEGDQTCKANQALHGEAVDLLAKIRANDHYVPDGRRPAVADHVRQQDQRAGVHGLPVDRRADRRSLPDPGRALHRHRPQVVHVHQRHPRRLARPGDLQPLVRLPRSSTSPSRRRSLNSAAIHAAAPVIYQEAMGIPGVTLPPDPIQLQPTYAGALAAFEQLPADPRPVRQRRRRPAARPAASRLRAVVAELPDPGHHRPLLVPRAPTARSATAARARRGPTRSPGTPTPGR